MAFKLIKKSIVFYREKGYFRRSWIRAHLCLYHDDQQRKLAVYRHEPTLKSESFTAHLQENKKNIIVWDIVQNTTEITKLDGYKFKKSNPPSNHGFRINLGKISIKILVDNILQITDWTNEIMRTETSTKRLSEQRSFKKILRNTFRKQKTVSEEKFMTYSKNTFNVYRIITNPSSTYFINIDRCCIKFLDTNLTLSIEIRGTPKRDFIWKYRQIKEIGVSENIFAFEVDDKVDIPDLQNHQYVTFFLTVDGESKLKTQFLFYAKKQFMDIKNIDCLSTIITKNTSQRIVNKSINYAGVYGDFQFIENPSYSPIIVSDNSVKPQTIVNVSIVKNKSSVGHRFSVETNYKSLKRNNSRCHLSMNVESFEKFIFEKKLKQRQLKKQKAINTVDEVKTVRQITEFYETLINDKSNRISQYKELKKTRLKSGIVRSFSGNSQCRDILKLNNILKVSKYKTL